MPVTWEQPIGIISSLVSLQFQIAGYIQPYYYSDSKERGRKGEEERVDNTGRGCVYDTFIKLKSYFTINLPIDLLG